MYYETMPIKSTIKDGMIFTEITGEINYNNTCQQIDFIASLKTKIKNLYELSDFTKVTNINLTADDLDNIASYLEKSKGTYPHSFVAYYVVNEFQYGMARMFQTHIELNDQPIVIKIFKDKEKALLFLKQSMERHG